MAMRKIWEAGPCAVRDLLSVYPEPKPPYTTLASIVKNLERKQYVKPTRMGNTYRYTPLMFGWWRNVFSSAFMFSTAFKVLDAKR